MQALCFQDMFSQVVIQIIGRVGKGREEQDLMIALIDGVFNLVQNKGLEVLQLGIVLGCDFCHGIQQGVNDFQIAVQVIFP